MEETTRTDAQFVVPGPGLPCTCLQVNTAPPPKFSAGPIDRTPNDEITLRPEQNRPVAAGRGSPPSHPVSPLRNSGVRPSASCVWRRLIRRPRSGSNRYPRSQHSVREGRARRCTSHLHNETGQSVNFSEPTSSTAPRVAADVSIAVLKRQRGHVINLLCQAQGFPAPLFRYKFEFGAGKKNVGAFRQ